MRSSFCLHNSPSRDQSSPETLLKNREDMVSSFVLFFWFSFPTVILFFFIFFFLIFSFSFFF